MERQKKKGKKEEKTGKKAEKVNKKPRNVPFTVCFENFILISV